MRVIPFISQAQFLDVYDATEEGLEWVHSASLIPEGEDTVRSSPSYTTSFS